MLGELTSKQSLLQFYSARLLNDLSRTFVDMGIWTFSELDSEIERLMFMDLGALSATLNALLNQIDANAPSESADSESSEKNSILASVHDYLLENALDPTLNINLEAEKFGMSSVTLNRRFRQCYGQTMVQFVSDIRMEKAKELLRTSDMRIKDIVTAVGYFDVPNFSRKFKASVGLTPGQYRKQERGDASPADDED